MPAPNKDRFAYDFELPVVEIDKQIQALVDKAVAEDTDLTVEIQKLEVRRDRLLTRIVKNLTAYEQVRLARHPLRPLPMDYVRMSAEELIELHGDRRLGDDRAIVTMLGKLGERRVMFIVHHKGRDTREKMATNFGMPQPEGYRKALQKMRLAEKFGLPVICLLDSAGAAPAVGAEERGQGMAIAENIFAMAGLATPIIVVVTGEGCSGGALGIGVGDRFAMLENAYYSVITPEGCGAILFRDGAKAAEAAEAMKLTARHMLEAGIIDTIIPEPIGGAHRDARASAASLREYLADTLAELAQIPIERLLDERYRRYRRLGVYREELPAEEAAGQASGD